MLNKIYGNAIISIALALAIIIFVIWVVSGSESFQTCFQNNKHASAYRSLYENVDIISKAIARIRLNGECGVHFFGDASSAITALATILIAMFTFTLKSATDKLWLAGERQRTSGETIAALQRESYERIGEAQVRAYVNINLATITFLPEFNQSPKIMFVASNTGQSPAQNFVWNTTVQYISNGIIRERPLSDSWVDGGGISIPAAAATDPQGAIVSMMLVNQFITEDIKSNISTFVARVRIDFKFTDVFEREWIGKAFFAGVIGSQIAASGHLQWSGRITSMSPPRDWAS
jgi:hypothetical protein